MSVSILNRDIQEELIDALWLQWAGLGVVRASKETGMIIDPEGLILLSLMMQAKERRLTDLLYGWAQHHARYLSVQRISTLARDLSPDVQQQLASFAACCIEHSDQRWKSLIEPGTTALQGRPNKVPRHLHFKDPATLLIRMRVAFGVGVKADTISVQLGLAPRQVTVRALAERLGYTVQAVRMVLQDLELSRLMRSYGRRPRTYSIDPEPWHMLLNWPTWPRWIDSFQLWLFLLEARQVADIDGAYAASDAARQLLEKNQPVFERNDIPAPDFRFLSGTAYLDGLEETVQHVLMAHRLHRYVGDQAGPHPARF